MMSNPSVALGRPELLLAVLAIPKVFCGQVSARGQHLPVFPVGSQQLK
jgi:hypothetical protein